VFDHENNLVSRYGSIQNSEELSWLVELANQKAGAEYTPRLKKIHLIDWNRIDPYLDDQFYTRNFPVCRFPKYSSSRYFPNISLLNNPDLYNLQPSIFADSLKAADMGLKISIRDSRLRDSETWTNVQEIFKEPSSAQFNVRNVQWHLEQ
jgi:hypothetical protein